MNGFMSGKEEAWKSHHAEFNCEHEKCEVRSRVIRGGSTQFVLQCLKCGKTKGNAISRAAAISQNAGVAPRSFDQCLYDDWEAKRASSAENIRMMFDKRKFFSDYDEYLQSEEWKKKRLLVIRRANGVCEGCGLRPPNEVHHLTYKNVGHEFLFQLVALCHQCHKEIHNEEEKNG